jgi:hypothetical protein
MTNKHDSELADLVAYQRSLCDEETLLALDQSKRPAAAKFHDAARGKYKWTAQERETIDADPKLLDYEARMLAAVRAATRRQPVTIPLWRAMIDAPAELELRAVARGACQSTDTVRFVNTEEGYDVLLFPADEDGYTTVRFVGSVPRVPFGLLVGDSVATFIKPIDQHGYAVVRDEDIRLVRAGVAELHVQVE